MKKTTTYIIFTLIFLVCASVQAQFPAGFNGPKGIFIQVDSAWHKNATVVIQRSDNSGAFKLLANIRVPGNEADFKAMLKAAGNDFSVNPVDENTISKWWNGLNGKPVMPVFMMNPAGMIAAGAGYYDKTALQGTRYNYRINITAADGSRIKEGNTGDILFSATESLPRPRFIYAGEDEKVTTMTWGYVPKKLPSTVKIFRLAEGDKEYREIGFNGGLRVKGDSVYITAKDTLVQPMAIYKYIIDASDWFGNSYPVSDTAVARAYSIYSAPVIRMFYTKPVPEKHAIRLSWPKIAGTDLRGILLFRSTSHDGKFLHLATLPGTDTAYMDVVSLANENYWYFAIVANRFGYGLPSTRVFDQVTASANPMKPAMPRLTSKGKGVEITWAYQGGIVKGYYIYRGEGYRGALKLLTGIIGLAKTMSYTDTTVIPGNAYCYAVAALGEGKGISPVSDAISLMIPANGKITVPYNLRYRNDNSNIILFWENLLVNDGLVSGYSVYRKISGQTAFVKLTATPLSSLTNSFKDSITFGGKTVEYAVASVDPKGIESVRSSSLSIDIPEPERIQVTGLSLINDGGNILVKWPVVFDPDIQSFKVFRFSETDEPVLIKTTNEDEFSFTDRYPVKGNKLNNYFVKAVYKDGSETEPGEIAAIRIP